MAPHTITFPPPNLSTCWTQFAAKRSLQRLYTLALPSARWRRKPDSSLNQTFLQRWSGHTLCVWDHWTLFWQCCAVRTTTRTGRLVLIPASRRRFRTVCWEILRNPGITDAVDAAVSNLWRKRMNRSCAGDVTRGRPDLGRSRVDPCCWKRFHKRNMVLCETFRTVATVCCDSPACNRQMMLLRWASVWRGWSALC